MYDTIIVGGGVAGLTAGLYLGRAKKKCLILEGRILGGQTALLNRVSNYPALPDVSGYDIAENLIKQVKSFDVEIKNELVIECVEKDNKFVLTTIKEKYESKNLIIATGAKTGVLGLPEEKRFVGRGVSYCATCDGNFFKGKVVAVVGVGNSAVQDITYLLGLAKQVIWFVPSENLSKQILQDVNNTNLKIIYSAQILSLDGQDKLQGVTYLDSKQNKSFNIKVDGLFVEMGRQPNLEWLKVEIKKNKKGFVLVNKNCQTSHKRIFACGDITSRELKQIVISCSDGAIASNYIITNDKFIN